MLHTDRKDKTTAKQKLTVNEHNDLKRSTYLEAPFRQALLTLDHQQHQLYLKSTQVRARQPVQCIQEVKSIYLAPTERQM